jgi:hypothetical protein
MSGEDHFCKFNNAYMVNKGKYGSTKLDGAKFWIYGDLGGDFSKGEMNWAVVTFDKATTKEQREGSARSRAKLFPVKWKSLTTAEGDIEWKASKTEAHALLDGGKTAEVQLGTSTLNPNVKTEPIVIQNLKYWGAPRNDGFIMMPNIVEALRVGDRAYEFKGSNGFMLTLDMSSKDFMAHEQQRRPVAPPLRSGRGGRAPSRPPHVAGAAAPAEMRRDPRGPISADGRARPRFRPCLAP